MPVYPFICKCGNQREVYSPKFEDLVKQICECNLEMKQDYTRKSVLVDLKGLGWSNHGHCTDIDQAEEEMKKRGEPVGHWVGNWCDTDKNGKAICNQRRKGRKKTEAVYVKEAIQPAV